MDCHELGTYNHGQCCSAWQKQNNGLRTGIDFRLTTHHPDTCIHGHLTTYMSKKNKNNKQLTDLKYAYQSI